MSNIATPIDFFEMLLHKAFKHWAPVSFILGITGSGFSMLFLYIYSNAIGRADIFLIALDAKTSLFVWFLGIVFLMMAYLFILTVTTLLYGLAVSMFSGAELRRKAATWLLLPLTIGFVALTVSTFFFHEHLSPPHFIVITATCALSVAFIYARSSSFRKMVDFSLESKTKHAKYGFLLQLSFLVLTTLLSSIFPVSLILKTYVGEDTQQALRFLVAFSLGTLILSLAPTYAFFALLGEMHKRLVLAGAILTVLFLFFMATAPGPASSISYAAAGKLEIRQHAPARFILDDHIKLEDFDNLQWKTRQDANNRVTIEAYQLFAIGDVLLLCPGSLLDTNLHQLPKYTPFCLLVRRDEVRRKPPRSSYAVKTIKTASWEAGANQFISWSNVRELIYPVEDRLIY